MRWRLGNIKLHLEQDEEELCRLAAKKLGVTIAAVQDLQIIKKSVDARDKRDINFVYTIDVKLAGNVTPRGNLRGVSQAPVGATLEIPDLGKKIFSDSLAEAPERPIVVGAGPAGIFAALYLAKAGLQPLVLERGKDVAARTADVEHFWSTGYLDPESNVAFGEGGAGTFSDGKLTTRINDPRVNTVLDWMVKAGAPEEIRFLAKPHVGTDRLRKVVQNLREQVKAWGGEVCFQARVSDIIVENGRVAGVAVRHGGAANNSENDNAGHPVIAGRPRSQYVSCRSVILATGHSARDVYRMLHAKGVALEAKSFAIGARVEHPQQLIDMAQYGAMAGHPKLGAADYHLTYQCTSTGRAAYTFCMCPGGQVVAAASEEGGVVTNGMSNFNRDSGGANSAVVITVNPDDFSKGPLGGIAFQKKWEQEAFKLGRQRKQDSQGRQSSQGRQGGQGRQGSQGKQGRQGSGSQGLGSQGQRGSQRTMFAPAQTVSDFLTGRNSASDIVEEKFAEKASYRPGVTGADLHLCLPEGVTATMEEALLHFDRKIKGFAGEDALLTGVETRTSAPVRLLRNENKESVDVEGLFPAGEGAGYAGGIVSAAVDGLKVAEALVAKMGQHL